MSKGNIKAKVTQQWESLVIIGRGIVFTSLVVSLVFITGFAVWARFYVDLPEAVTFMLSVATAVMIVYSGSLLIRVFNKIGKE